MDWQIIVAAVLGSQVLVEILKRIFAKSDEKNDIRSRLEKLEKDGLRTQLLLMILLNPNEKKEILTLAQHYFVDLEGNWYMTDIFDKWCEEVGGSKPEWFKKDE